MRKFAVVLVVLLITTLAIPGFGQTGPSNTVQGTLQAVDCLSQAIVVDTPYGTRVFPAAYAAVFINSVRIPLCSLQQYLGSNVTVYVGSSGNQVIAGRIDVYQGFAAGIPPIYAPQPVYPSPPAYTPPPQNEVYVGLALFFGILYLLTQDQRGHHYRRPLPPHYTGPRRIYHYDPYHRFACWERRGDWCWRR